MSESVRGGITYRTVPPQVEPAPAGELNAHRGRHTATVEIPLDVISPSGLEFIIGSSSGATPSLATATVNTIVGQGPGFTDVAFGPAFDGRVIVLLLTVGSFNIGTTGEVTAVTIAGVAATRAARVTDGAAEFNTEVWYAEVPSGESGDIDLTVTGNLERRTGAIFSQDGWSEADDIGVGVGSVTISDPPPFASIVIAASIDDGVDNVNNFTIDNGYEEIIRIRRGDDDDEFGVHGLTSAVGTAAEGGTFVSSDANVKLTATFYPGTPSDNIGSFTLGYWIEQVGEHFLGWTDVDASTLTDTLYGFQSDDISFQRDLQTIREVFDFYIVDHDGAITCARATESATADVTLTIADMVNTGSADRPDYVRTRVAEPSTLPHGVQIEFTDAERLYIRRYAEPAVRQDIALSPNRISKYSIPFAMLEADVKALQWVLLWNLWAASTTYALTVQSAKMDITPGTLIQFPFSSNSEFLGMGEVVTATMREGDTQELALKAVLIEKAVTVAASPIAVTPNTPLWANQSTIYIHLDIPFQGGRSVDQDGAGIVEYGVLTSDQPYFWSGGRLLRSDDGGTTYVEIHSQTSSPFWGTVATPLGAYDYTQGMDEATTLVVQMFNGSTGDLQVLTELQAAAGTVKLAYGRPGRWEILYPRSMVHAGSGVVNVTDFYRGQEGTDWAINSHQAGDYAVIIDLDRMAEQEFVNPDIDIASGEVTSTRQYKAAGSQQSTSVVTATTEALSGASHIPYAVADYTATRAGSPSVLTLSGVRRDRFSPLDAFDAAPNSDRDDTRSPPVNTFILRIYTANSPPDRTVTIDTDDHPTYDYSDADQTTDFGAPLSAGDAITLSWQQVRIMDDGRELYGRVLVETITVTE